MVKSLALTQRSESLARDAKNKEITAIGIKTKISLQNGKRAVASLLAVARMDSPASDASNKEVSATSTSIKQHVQDKQKNMTT